MLRPDMGSVKDVHVTVHATNALRLFHTLFSSQPVRVLCYAPDEEGHHVHFVHDLVVPPRRVALLPPHQVQLTLPANVHLPLPLLHAQAQKMWRSLHLPRTGWGDDELEQSGVRALFMRMLLSALYDLKTVLGTPFHILPLERRARVVTAAAFLVDNQVDGLTPPPTAVKTARQILRMLKPEEVQAYHHWQIVDGLLQDLPGECIRCGKTAEWHQVVSPTPEVPELQRWRYLLPENHVPICYNCRRTLNWHSRPDIRQWAALALWGARFVAFLHWHEASRTHSLPENWDMNTHPYWPPEFGGNTWESGSGAMEDVDPHRVPDLKGARARFAAMIDRLKPTRRRDKIATPPSSVCYSENKGHDEEVGGGHSYGPQPSGSKFNSIRGL